MFCADATNSITYVCYMGHPVACSGWYSPGICISAGNSLKWGMSVSEGDYKNTIVTSYNTVKCKKKRFGTLGKL